MALLGSGFDANTPRDSDPVSLGAAEIRAIKQVLKSFLGEMFDLDTGLFLTPNLTLPIVSAFPSDPTIGQVVFNQITNAAYVYTSSGWSFLSQPSQPIGALQTYTGAIADVTTAFSGVSGTWVVADGSAIDRATYAAYFSLVGTTYGVGDGSTTFNIPDLRNMFVVGASADDSGIAKSTVGDGAALLKTRAYTSHTHLPALEQYATGANGGDFPVRAGLNGNESVRTLPPFSAQVILVRIA